MGCTHARRHVVNTEYAFGPLVVEGWQCLTGLPAPLVFLPDAVIFEQEDDVQGAYLVEDGLVKLVRTTSDGDEVIVGLRSCGSVLGASSLLLDAPHRSTAQTLTTVRMRFLPASTFTSRVNSDPELRMHLVRAMSQEIHLQIARQELLTSVAAEQRLEKLSMEVNSLPEKYRRDPHNILGLPLKQWEIAQLLSITPEHLSRIRKRVSRKTS